MGTPCPYQSLSAEIFPKNRTPPSNHPASPFVASHSLCRANRLTSGRSGRSVVRDFGPFRRIRPLFSAPSSAEGHRSSSIRTLTEKACRDEERRHHRDSQPHQGLPRLLGPTQGHGPQGARPEGPQGRDLRPARPQRVGQDHHDQAPARPPVSHRGGRASSSGSPRRTSPRTSGSATSPRSRTFTNSSTPRKRSTSMDACSSCRRRSARSGSPA